MKARSLMKDYLDQRILFYLTRSEQQLRVINDRTTKLQADMWAAVEAPVNAQPNPVNGLAVSGMNDVLNAQAYTQAAWWNGIPLGAWILMALIAVLGHLMVGYGEKNIKSTPVLMLALPLVISTAFFLIADVDSPRGGIIPVKPDNLVSFAESLRAPAAKL